MSETNTNSPDIIYLPDDPEAEEAVRLYHEATRLADEADFAAALEHANAIRNCRFKLAVTFSEEACVHVVSRLEEAGDIGRAESVAATMVSPQHRAGALYWIVRALVGHGSRDDALRIASTISEPSLRERAQAEIAGTGST